MAQEQDRREVRVERLVEGVYRATNPRGDHVTFGSSPDAGFSPVELLLAAIGGCSAVDVDVVTTRHAEPERFRFDVSAVKVRDDAGSILRDVGLTIAVTFPDGEGGDRARDRLPRAVRASHERNCTVSRTVEAATPVSVRLQPPAP